MSLCHTKCILTLTYASAMTLVSATSPHENMLKSQILTGNVLDQRVIDALTQTSREPFVPDAMQGAAYVDEEIMFEGGRFIMEPLAFARVLKHAAIAPHETVMDIGSAQGYSAAVLSKLAQKVVAVEEDLALAAKAKSLLSGYSNVEVVQGLLVHGASKTAPYDVIIIEGAIQCLSDAMSDQLCEGGRLLAIEHSADAKVASAGLGRLVEYRKLRGALYKTSYHNENVTLLTQFAKPAAFTF